MKQSESQTDLGSASLSNSEARAAFAISREDRDRTLAAVRALESALAMASAGEEWLSEVTSDLRTVESAMNSERQELNRPDSLLALIAADAPRRFGPRIRGIREQYDDITRQVGSLLREAEQPDGIDVDPGDLRQRCASLIRAVHHCRARQTDLVFEALRLDLGER